MRVALATLASLALVASMACNNNDNNNGSNLAARFTPSSTPASPGLVKLVQKSRTNDRVVVSAVVYGPQTNADLYSFSFDVNIGDPTIVKWVNGTGTAGNALTTSAGQTIHTVVNLGSAPGGGNDNSVVTVAVGKVGGGTGNGFTGQSATIVTMTFQVLKQGTTTLTLSGSPAPTALNSSGTPIAGITFDTAPATITGVAS